jgi:hypothetical protein
MQTSRNKKVDKYRLAEYIESGLKTTFGHKINNPANPACLAEASAKAGKSCLPSGMQSIFHRGLKKLRGRTR